MIVTQAEAGRSIEEIASSLRVNRAIIIIYLYLGEAFCPSIESATAKTLLDALESEVSK